ncbi:MAG TPA: 3-deoxy-D-manno-octulosonic acid transferase [Gammaproteobacteria bacterium]|nr:3-deoxy-D-manno-octulosonic acid transferase [Gammaproteobacteria bacterium]
MAWRTPPSLLGYRVTLYLLAPVLLAFNAWQAARAADPRLFWQRLGLFLPRRNDAPLWLHAASVGELMAARPLIAALRLRHPRLPLLVTTFTPTAARLARARLPAGVEHLYLPLDWPGAVRRFLCALQPRAALIMETELWPNLFARLEREDVPLLIVNARLSARTFETRGWIRRLHAVSLKRVDAVLARSDSDAAAYIRLGAPPERVRTVGNIKYAAPPGEEDIPPTDLGRPYILAASTHEDEERQLAAIWRDLQRDDYLLVIAPRHPGRREAILQQLRPLAQEIAVRSRAETPNDRTGIYLADTLGELEGFMAGAALVFMGGSLVPRGGHNILEPARLGRPILFGPHMDNFREESELLLAEEAALRVADTGELRAALQRALDGDPTIARLGHNVRRVMERQGEVLERYLERVLSYCELE